MKIPEDVLSEEFILQIFDIEDSITRQRTIIKAREKAKEKKQAADFDKLIKLYEREEAKTSVESAQESAENTEGLDWLQRTRYGRVKNSIENYSNILQKDYAGLFVYNELRGRPERVRQGGYKLWGDEDSAYLRRNIERRYGIYSVKKLDDAFRENISLNSYHPVKKIIESIEWDGQNRIETLLIKHLKCEDTPYTRECSRIIFAGGIHRIYNPGCKFDNMVVLVGTKQGEGKSTFVRWLALRDEFFREVKTIDGQRGIEEIEGGWICEVAELLAVTRAKEVEAVKAYLTCQIDNYRKPFDRFPTESKRQCIFIGTTNKERFLPDKTGNRRYFPVKVHTGPYELFEHEKEVKQDILQCWAEAYARYRDNNLSPVIPKWLEADVKLEQEAAVEDDYRIGMIRSYLDLKQIDEKVCVIELWERALQNTYQKPTRKESNEISLIMQGFDDWGHCKGVQRCGKYGTQRVWIKKTPAF